MGSFVHLLAPYWLIRVSLEFHTEKFTRRSKNLENEKDIQERTVNMVNKLRPRGKLSRHHGNSVSDDVNVAVTFEQFAIDSWCTDHNKSKDGAANSAYPQI